MQNSLHCGATILTEQITKLIYGKGSLYYMSGNALTWFI